MSSFRPGEEVEIIQGIRKGVVVRLIEPTKISDVGVQMWIADWPGVRPITVREDFIRRREAS